MKLRNTVELMQAAGTSEGVRKAWDTRGRGRKPGDGFTMDLHPFGARPMTYDPVNRVRRPETRDEQHRRGSESSQVEYNMRHPDGSVTRHSAFGSDFDVRRAIADHIHKTGGTFEPTAVKYGYGKRSANSSALSYWKQQVQQEHDSRWKQ